MTVNSQRVLVGAPDQLTTGAILRAALGSTLPTTAVATLDAAFNIDPGYVDEAGLTISPTRQTTPIRDWSRAIIRNVLESFDGKLSWNHLELNLASAKNYFGVDNVAAVAANGSHGAQLAMKFKAVDLEHACWVMNMKDGTNKIRVVLPDANVTEQGQISLVANNAIKLPVVVSAYPDSTGTSIYIYTDDGVLTA